MKKYQKGEVIKNINELESVEFIIFYDKVYNKGFWQSWHYGDILWQIKSGNIFRAEKIDRSQERSKQNETD